MLAACANLVFVKLRRERAGRQDDCRPGQRNSGKNQSAGRPAGTRKRSSDARRGAHARWQRWRRSAPAPGQPASCGSHAMLCLDKPMGCLRCLEPPWRLGLCRPFCPAACPVPDGGEARWCDVTCVIGCESIAAGFVWSSGNTRSRESFLSALCGRLFASPLQHAVKHTACLKARAGKALRRGINAAWHQG